MNFQIVDDARRLNCPIRKDEEFDERRCGVMFFCGAFSTVGENRHCVTLVMKRGGVHSMKVDE